MKKLVRRFALLLILSVALFSCSDLWGPLNNPLDSYADSTATMPGPVLPEVVTKTTTVLGSLQCVVSWGSAGSGDGQFGTNDYADGMPRSIVVDGKGYVYIADSLNNRIQKFDAQGGFVTKWGSQGSGQGQFSNVDRLCVDGKDRIFAVDSNNNRVEVFSENGSFITQLGGQSGSGSGQLVLGGGNGARGVAVDSEGSLYVMDTNNYRIVKYITSDDVHYEYLGAWGSKGSGVGQFDWGYSANIVVDAYDFIYVSDYNNRRIQKFDANGNLVRVIDCSFCIAYVYITIDNESDILYALDVYNNAIHAFNLDGTFIGTWIEGGIVNFPSSFAYANGFIYVLDINEGVGVTSNDRVLKFSIIR